MNEYIHVAAVIPESSIYEQGKHITKAHKSTRKPCLSDRNHPCRTCIHIMRVCLSLCLTCDAPVWPDDCSGGPVWKWAAQHQEWNIWAQTNDCPSGKWDLVCKGSGEWKVYMLPDRLEASWQLGLLIGLEFESQWIIMYKYEQGKSTSSQAAKATLSQAALNSYQSDCLIAFDLRLQ